MHPASDPLSGLLPALAERLQAADTKPVQGRLVRAIGPVLRARVFGASIGELCRVTVRDGPALLAEVVGIDGDEVVLTPLGDLHQLVGGAEVRRLRRPLETPVGDALLGRVLDGLGRPLDGRPLEVNATRPVLADPPSPLARQRIARILPSGVRAIDALLTLGEGQRVGLFGEPGAGKSTLLGMIVRRAEAEVVVIGLIGERGREVRETLELSLGPEALARSVVVVATSDRPAVERARAAHVATAIAEHFRDEGRRTLLVMDSLTRFARALREIGLSAGEPPTRRGFPPSVFAELPRLLERAGPGERASITAIYTVLVEGDGSGDPVAEEVRAILDGHIILSPELARADHYPAIDVLASRSRLMEILVDPAHRHAASRFRQLLARHRELELLIRVGEYRAGSDPLGDEAVAKIDRLNAFLRQGADEPAPFAETLARLQELAG